MVLEFLLVNTR